MRKIEIKVKDIERETVKKYYGIKTAKEIADILECSVNRVYKINQIVIQKRLNVEINFNQKQEQVILSGILGDGNIKRNGRNYYYRETHAKKEKEYCEFKHNMLQPYISKGGFKISDKRDGQWGFQTINSPSLKEYKKMSKSEVIDRLDDFGLVLFLLDDGWKKTFGWNVSVCDFNQDERNLLIKKLNSVFNISSHEIKVDAVSITKDNIIPILKSMKKHIPHDIDIYKNKIENLIKKFKV